MADDDRRQKCRRTGCGVYFSDDDADSECRFHPGVPFFHDAYKGWTCCQQKSTDFTTFLNFKPCKTGNHSTEAPPELPSIAPPKSETAPEKNTEEETEEEDESEEWTAVAVREASSVAKAATTATAQKTHIQCKRCRKRKETTDETTECRFHSGHTIFHETLKYWTCCANKKFTDFGDFEAFKGCQTAEEHDFSVAPKAVREDWFQTSSHVHLVLYGLRGARAAATRLQCKGGREVSALFADCEGNAFWTREWTLWAGVRARQSEVVLEATKAELRLKKAKEGQHWASFS